MSVASERFSAHLSMTKGELSTDADDEVDDFDVHLRGRELSAPLRFESKL